MKAAAESTLVGALFNKERAQVIELRAKLAAKDVVLKLTVKASCATLWLSIKSLVKNFCVSLNKSVGAAFLLGSLDAQFYVGTALDGVNLNFSEGTPSDDGETSKTAKALSIRLATKRSSSYR